MKLDRRDIGLIISSILVAIIIAGIALFLLSTFKRSWAVYSLRNYHSLTKLEVVDYIRILSESDLSLLTKLRKDPQGLPILFIDMSMARVGEEGVKELEMEAAKESGETRVWELAALENAKPGFLKKYFEASQNNVPRWLEAIHAASLVEAYTAVDFAKVIEFPYICLFPGKKEIDEKIMREFQGGLNQIYLEPDEDPSGKAKTELVANFLKDQLERHPEIYKKKTKESDDGLKGKNEPKSGFIVTKLKWVWNLLEKPFILLAQYSDAYKEKSRERWEKSFEGYVLKLFERRSVSQQYKLLVQEFINKHGPEVPPEEFELINRYLSERYMENPVNLLDEKKMSENKSLKGSVVLGAHQGAVLSVAVSPVDGMIASAGFDNTIKLWSTKGKGDPRTLKGHKLGILTLDFSRDGKKLASAGLDGTIRVWDLIQGKEMIVIPAKTSRVQAVAFSPDGAALAAAGPRGSVRMFDAQTGNELRVLSGLNGEVTSLDFASDGKQILASSLDRTVRVWNLEGKGGQAEAKIFKKHTDGVWKAVFLPDGQSLVSASADQTLNIFEITKEKAKPKTLKGHQGIVMTLACSPDGKMVASTSNDKTLRLWSAEKGNRLVAHQLDAVVNAMAFTRDGKNLILGCDDSSVVIWPISLEGGLSKTLMDWIQEIFSKG